VTAIDVVVVAYNSRDHLRRCVEPLAAIAGVRVVVVDNASPDGGVETVADLPVTVVVNDRNGGFSYGCNRGWRVGDAPYVLFVNPDAHIAEPSLRALAAVLDGNPGVAIAGPRIALADGTTARSQRRFPRLAATCGRALFLNRVFPRWASELVDEDAAYERPGRPDWISGACMLVRRSVLEQLGGLDEGFFLYCEDKDLCRRARDAGYEVAYEPSAVAGHAEGASAPRRGLRSVLAQSRVRYARKHGGLVAATLERAGLALLAVRRLVVTRGGS
jgi:N-acetylglucosaminyl-diphospho-decaprenol L-rhamnosyltransferase